MGAEYNEKHDGDEGDDTGSSSSGSTACALATSLIRARAGILPVDSDSAARTGFNSLSYSEMVPASSLVQQHVRLLLARPVSHEAMKKYLTEQGPQPYRCPYSPHTIRLLATLCGVDEAEVHRQLQPPLMRALVQRLYTLYQQMERACPHRSSAGKASDFGLGGNYDSSNGLGRSDEELNAQRTRVWQEVVLARMQASMAELCLERREKIWEAPESRQDAILSSVPAAPWRRK